MQGSVRDDLVEAIHELRLGEHGKLGQRAILETAVKPTIEWGAFHREPSQRAEAVLLVPFERRTRPGLVPPECRAVGQHARDE